jgi:TctA family transporter
MTLSILFWVLYVVSILFSLYTNQVNNQPFPFRTWAGSSLIVFILLGILGWAVFGSVVKGG